MIAGHQIILRPFERRHLDVTRTWLNDAENARLLNRACAISEVEHQRWFAGLHDHASRVYLAIERLDNAGHVGNVWLWDIDSRHSKAEVRIVIGDHSVAGRGIGSEAIDLVCRYGFEVLNLHRLYAYVLEINPRARRAFEKAGFALEGTLRKDRWADDHYVDVFVLGRNR